MKVDINYCSHMRGIKKNKPEKIVLATFNHHKKDRLKKGVERFDYQRRKQGRKKNLLPFLED